MFDSRILTSAAMLAIFAGMSAAALAFPPKAQFMPLLVGVPGTLLALTQFVSDLRKRPARVEPTPEQVDERRREIGMFAWLGLFAVGILGFGFLYAAPLLVFAFLRFGQKESWVVAVIGGVGAWAILYGMFELMLGLILFEGLLVEML